MEQTANIVRTNDAAAPIAPENIGLYIRADTPEELWQAFKGLTSSDPATQLILQGDWTTPTHAVLRVDIRGQRFELKITHSRTTP